MCSIECVVDPGPLGGSRQIQAEALVVEPSFEIETRTLNKRNPELSIGVLFAGTWFEEISELAGGPYSIGVIRSLGRYRLIAVDNRSRRLGAAEIEFLPIGAEAEIGV